MSVTTLELFSLSFEAPTSQQVLATPLDEPVRFHLTCGVFVSQQSSVHLSWSSLLLLLRDVDHRLLSTVEHGRRQKKAEGAAALCVLAIGP